MAERVAVVGSRDYPDWRQVREYVESLPAGTVVVSGGARGVDAIAEKAARLAGLAVDVYPADWQTYGMAAGMIRNRQIVKNCHRVVAFWDGKSKGTKNTIDLAVAMGKPVTVFSPEYFPVQGELQL
jgi:hypothetical protein